MEIGSEPSPAHLIRRHRPPSGGVDDCRHGPDQIGVRPCRRTIRQEKIVLEADAHMAAEQRRRRDAGRLVAAEGAHHPRTEARLAGRQEGQQVGGRGLLRLRIAAEHVEHRHVIPGQGALGSQPVEPPGVLRIVEDDLRHRLLARQPGEEIGKGLLLAADAQIFAQRQRHGLGPRFPDDAHLLLGLVDAERFAGDLDDEPVADRVADGGGRGAVGIRVEQMAGVGVAHMDMDHRRARFQALRRRSGKFDRRERQRRMVRPGLAAAIRRDRDGYAAVIHRLSVSAVACRRSLA
jgi:hypothetical protein